MSDSEAEKLSQEAFRLYRTAQNLLNLQDASIGDAKTAPFQVPVPSDLKSNGCSGQSNYTTLSTLQRKQCIRESHSSFKSSSTSDGSIPSSSSPLRPDISDEHSPANLSSSKSSECNANATIINSACVNRSIATAVGSQHHKRSLANEIDAIDLAKDRMKSVASSADDESGFSSMNSFHHEANGPSLMSALPLSSTIIASQMPLVDIADIGHHEPFARLVNDDQRPLNVCGPFGSVQIDASMANVSLANVDRYDVAPPIPPKKKLTSFSALKNDASPESAGSMHVLWV